MHPGDQSRAARAEAAQLETTAPLSGQLPSPASPNGDGHAGEPAQPVSRPLMGRRWAALAWTIGGVALFVLLLRIALSLGVASDVANNELQAWDMLHGHLLLHG